MSITRRDFLNGVALTVGTGLTPMQQLMAQQKADGVVYPPMLTGMRGNHPGSNEFTHPLAFGVLKPDLDDAPEREQYDLVVVGAGISGLSAAWFYRQHHPDARILILDNHDDFGGHAKRNEMGSGEHFRITYGGSEAIENPEQDYDETAKALLRDLGIDYHKFEQYFDLQLYQKQGLKAGIFFDEDHFGVNKLTIGDPYFDEDDPAQCIAQFPLEDEDKQAILKLFTQPDNYLPEMKPVEVEAYLSKISYADFLQKHVGLSSQAIQYFQAFSSDNWGYGIDGRSALEGYYDGYPGFAAMTMPKAEEEEPYIYHFPDGNASIARLLVRGMIPSVASGHTMEDIVPAVFDYSQLDRPEHLVKIRLNSTAVDVRNRDGGVDVGYMTHGQRRMVRVRAKHCVLACYHRSLPTLVEEIGEEQVAALQRNVKIPILYGRVLLKNWHVFKKLGVHTIYCPTAPYCLVKLDYPVSMGGYRCAQTPDEAIVVHMVRMPAPYGTLSGVREMAQLGRKLIYGLPYEALETEMLAQLQTIFELGGEQLQPLIEAVTINRWAHGYSHETAMLWDDERAVDNVLQTARRAIGNVHIANSDSAWSAYVPAAIGQAHRAVAEIFAPSA